MSNPSGSAPSWPETTVGALILNDSGQVFLFRSHKWHDAWAIPGGHIEPGESAVDALHREVREETGLSITDVQFLCYQECIFDPAFWEQKHYIFLDFVCRATSHEVTLNDEAQAWAWFAPEALENLNIEPFTRKVLEEYFEKANGG